MADVNELRAGLAEILPKSQHNKIDRIIELFDLAETVNSVELHYAHVGIETVEAYGLTIKLDAVGDAAEVEFPYGAMVLS